jgi:uncharacterized membrane protein YgaE (UPF0421/DUF939 family)
MHTAIKENVGSSLIAVKSFAKSIIITTLFFTMPIQFLLSFVSQRTAQIIFPPISFLMSFLIMSCPWLTAPNLMVLVMYVAAASPLRFESFWWQPLGYLGSYLIGLAVALLMNLMPPFRPNTATRQAHQLMQRMDKDFFLLFMQVRYYTFNTGQSPKVARAAGATIDLLVKRINPTIQKLKELLPSIRAEAITKNDKAKVERLDRWITHLEKASIHFKMLRTALNSRYLGENNGNDPGAIDIRHAIASELGLDYHELVNSIIAAMVALNKHANPYFDNDHNFAAHSSELSDRLVPTHAAFARALYKVSEQLEPTGIKEKVPPTQSSSGSLTSSRIFVPQATYMSEAAKIPIYAHLARRMTSMYSFFAIGQGLIDFMTEIQVSSKSDTADSLVEEGQNVSLISKGLAAAKSFCQSCLHVLQACPKYLIDTWWAPEWKWRDSGTRRLALKTALGMFIASFWISIPYLWDIAQPYGFWPGLTIASVNLSTTGSSFHKAVDRLFGTLFAAAYALIVVGFFPGNKDYIKIPAIALFTFVVIYMMKSDHAYQYTYAATSIGSMLYGSVKNNFDVEVYVPKRIQLIFIGVLIFTIIELFIFPRSSRKIVEQKCLEFFDQASTFLEKSSDFMKRMQQKNQLETYSGLEETDRTERSGSSDGRNLDYTEPLESLCKVQKALHGTSAALKNEVAFALQEPHFGFHQPLNPQALNALVSEVTEAEEQACFLVDALKNLSSLLLKDNINADMKAPYPSKPMQSASALDNAGAVHDYYRENRNSLPKIDLQDHSSNLDWFRAYSAFIQIASEQMKICQTNLEDAYPDGRFRPQNQNTLKAILAAASFRAFHDARFSIVSEWSRYCRRIGFRENGDTDTYLLRPDRLPMLGITTSLLLEMCRHLQEAGLKMELYIQTFPLT